MYSYNFGRLGLYRLHISDNPLPEMPDDSLMGLERSLWELALQRDRLTSVPNRAIRYMRKLRLLDLTGKYSKVIKLIISLCL